MMPAGSQSPQWTSQANLPSIDLNSASIVVTRSALLPRQTLEAPASRRIAPVPIIELALEPVQDIVDLGEPCALERLAGFLRAVSAAANEQDRAPGVIGACEFLHLTYEMRIDFPIGAVVPGHVQRSDRMADEQILHLAAAIDEQCIRVLMQELVGFLGFGIIRQHLQVVDRSAVRQADYGPAPI